MNVNTLDAVRRKGVPAGGSLGEFISSAAAVPVSFCRQQAMDETFSAAYRRLINPNPCRPGKE
jgi:hypothetical protein